MLFLDSVCDHLITWIELKASYRKRGYLRKGLLELMSDATRVRMQIHLADALEEYFLWSGMYGEIKAMKSSPDIHHITASRIHPNLDCDTV